MRVRLVGGILIPVRSFLRCPATFSRIMQCRQKQACLRRYIRSMNSGRTVVGTVVFPKIDLLAPPCTSKIAS